MLNMKICKECGKEKLLKEFSKGVPYYPERHQDVCIDCVTKKFAEGSGTRGAKERRIIARAEESRKLNMKIQLNVTDREVKKLAMELKLRTLGLL